jgi:hypothetical protein
MVMMFGIVMVSGGGDDGAGRCGVMMGIWWSF